MTEHRIKAIWERIDEQLRASMDEALAKYRAGADEVSFEFGGLRMRFSDLKNNDERERVQITVPKMLTMLREMAIAGAAMAASTMAQTAALQAGYVLADPDEQGDEG